VAVACILLVLAFSGLEAMHSHPHARMAGGSGSCQVCVGLHSNAVTPTFHTLPTLLMVAIVAVPPQAEGHGIGKELSLFIRPPPAL
jgi:hypothetical protein